LTGTAMRELVLSSSAFPGSSPATSTTDLQRAPKSMVISASTCDIPCACGCAIPQHAAFRPMPIEHGNESQASFSQDVCLGAESFIYPTAGFSISQTRSGMARPQKRKRSDPDEPSPKHQLNKKTKSKRSPSNFAPEFWDNLSKVCLTPRALRELDRRQNNQPAPKVTTPDVDPVDLGRFARRGGPDLQHLRGVCRLAARTTKPAC
jgi:hypothetical protein